jgi:hypothetical protein
MPGTRGAYATAIPNNMFTDPMDRSRLSRLGTLVAGGILLVGGIGMLRVSRFAAPKGALFALVGALLLIAGLRSNRNR